MTEGDYYREKQHRKGRLVKIVDVSPGATFAETVSVCGRDGEESAHRKRIVYVSDLMRRYDKVERNEPCCCMKNGQSAFAAMDEKLMFLTGDCYKHHKVFVCGGCGRVTPWCRGGDREDSVDPDGDLCDDCAVARMEAR